MHTRTKARHQLQSYLDEAVDAGADAVVLEYVPEGLKVCFQLDNSGVGRVLEG